MKKILFMGGGVLQSQAILRAKELGYYTISVDALENCSAKECADEFYCISSTDTEKVYELACKKEIDGVLSYASDVAAYSASVIAERLNLPTNPSKSVDILTNKYKFRQFMHDEGLSKQIFSEFNNYQDAYFYMLGNNYPVIIKPVDSCGSKGVIKVDCEQDLKLAFDRSKKESRSGNVIIEEYIQRKGYQIDGDGFIKDGKIVFWGVMDQHKNMNCNPFAPIGLSYPSCQNISIQNKAREKVQRVFNKLDMKFGAFNFEYFIDENDEIFIVEIGPRNGGNYIPNTLKTACGVDMITASIKACVGDDYSVEILEKHAGFATSYVVHSLIDGKYDGLNILNGMKGKVEDYLCYTNIGEEVHAFRGGRDSIGLMTISYEDFDTMNYEIENMWKYISVKTR